MEQILHHVAVYFKGKQQARRFFEQGLGLALQYAYDLGNDLAEHIFACPLCRDMHVRVYQLDARCLLEVFCADADIAPHPVAHLCLSLPGRESLVTRCRDHGVRVQVITRPGKADLVFVIDPSGNRYEIKEE